jgi:hypothetical protein
MAARGVEERVMFDATLALKMLSYTAFYAAAAYLPLRCVSIMAARVQERKEAQRRALCRARIRAAAQPRFSWE